MLFSQTATTTVWYFVKSTVEEKLTERIGNSLLSYALRFYGKLLTDFAISDFFQFESVLF